ncbi:MAG TPA: hypothetical protein VFW65_02980 [Pseudonocardiaceae bacterium]|nr:hypothetical protein [Pseudonocardiaceae bacterium]
MQLRKIGILAVAAVVGTGLAVMSVGTASAAGRPNALIVTGPCGDLLTFVERVQGTLIVDINLPTTDPNETWSLTAQEQKYDPVTGGRVGLPIDLVPNILPEPAFSSVEGGFDTTNNFVDTAGATYGFSYTATRTLPTPETCTSQGFWTHPANVAGPVAGVNPLSRPNTAPARTGNDEADAGANDVLMQFDQEMQAGPQGIPANNRFSVTVGGVARTVTGVSVIDDSPPLDAVVDVTFDGLPLTAGQVVSVQYRKQLSSGLPQLQDLDGFQTANFGPISVTAF